MPRSVDVETPSTFSHVSLMKYSKRYSTSRCTVSLLLRVFCLHRIRTVPPSDHRTSLTDRRWRGNIGIRGFTCHMFVVVGGGLFWRTRGFGRVLSTIRCRDGWRSCPLSALDRLHWMYALPLLSLTRLRSPRFQNCWNSSVIGTTN